MSNNGVFTNNYEPSSKILTGKIEIPSMEKEDAKSIYDLTFQGLQQYPEYSDYILDASAVNEVTVASFGYLMKVHSTVKKTAGYLLLVLTEDILQKFMISNPEMFDLFAVFFNADDAVKYIKSKR